MQVQPAGPAAESQLSSGTVRIQFQTHWVPGTPYVRSIRVTSTGNGSPISHCYSMGTYRPDVDMWPFIQVDLPPGSYEESSYNGPVCDVGYQTAGGYGPLDTNGHNWMVYARYVPSLRA